jgi:hypothetical protein
MLLSENNFLFPIFVNAGHTLATTFGFLFDVCRIKMGARFQSKASRQSG